MARTTYFTHGTRNEQFLQQNLVEEYLKMFGMDVLYCPREIMQTDGVFNEEVIGEFNDAYIIEAYMENFDGFQGAQLPGGISMNGEFIYNEGKEAVNKLEEEMLTQYETPPLDMIG